GLYLVIAFDVFSLDVDHCVLERFSVLILYLPLQRGYLRPGNAREKHQQCGDAQEVASMKLRHTLPPGNLLDKSSIQQEKARMKAAAQPFLRRRAYALLRVRRAGISAIDGRPHVPRSRRHPPTESRPEHRDSQRRQPAAFKNKIWRRPAFPAVRGRRRSR